MNRYKVVFLRHGESRWNKNKRFTGWTDISLSDRGRQEAKESAQLLQKNGFTFDLAFCSVLKRAIETLNIVLQEMDLTDIPINYNWRLNERHYGSLQGKYKPDVAKKAGQKQLMVWRRSFTVPPPPLEKPDYNYCQFDMNSQRINKKEFPLSESLKNVQERVLPYWLNTIVPNVKTGKKVIIFAHGNSIRALVKYFDNISDESIAKVNIPTGIPLVYEFDRSMQTIGKYYLGDPERVKAATQKVLNEAK